jgi:hypothetical protein
MERKSRQMLWIGISISAVAVLLIAGVVIVLTWFMLHGKTWTPYASAAGKFKVMFCGEVKESVRTSGGPGNTENDYTISAESPHGAYVSVTWTDFSPWDFKNSTTEEVVDDHALRGLTFGTLISQNKGMRNGLYAHTIEYQSNFDGKLECQMVVKKGNRIYTVFGGGPKTENVRKDLQTFLDSFDVTE